MRGPLGLPLPVAVVWLLPGCGAFRLDYQSGQIPLTHEDFVLKLTGKPVQPTGRHIQYLFHNNPHGITDRLDRHFRYLVMLGKYFNAEVHIDGGEDDAANWLDVRHSEETAASWTRYVDTRANGGNPFHRLVNFEGCRTISDPHFNMATIFDQGHQCVNILDHAVNFNYDKMRGTDDNLQPSRVLRAATDEFKEQVQLPPGYGTVHVRRCDRMHYNEKCTEPSAISQAIQPHRNISVWLVFMYAEADYPPRLKAELAKDHPSKRFIFEGEVPMNQEFPQDNYFTFLMGKILSGEASVNVETHLCAWRPAPTIIFRGTVNGLYLSQIPIGTGKNVLTLFRGSESSQSEAAAELADKAELRMMSSAFCESKLHSPALISGPGATRQLPKKAWKPRPEVSGATLSRHEVSETAPSRPEVSETAPPRQPSEPSARPKAAARPVPPPPARPRSGVRSKRADAEELDVRRTLAKKASALASRLKKDRQDPPKPSAKPKAAARPVPRPPARPKSGARPVPRPPARPMRPRPTESAKPNAAARPVPRSPARPKSGARPVPRPSARPKSGARPPPRPRPTESAKPKTAVRPAPRSPAKARPRPSMGPKARARKT